MIKREIFGVKRNLYTLNSVQEEDEDDVVLNIKDRELIEELKRKSPTGKVALLNSSELSPSFLKAAVELYEDEDPTLYKKFGVMRVAAVKHKNATKEVIKAAIKSPISAVRSAALDVEKFIDEEVIEGLMDDPDPQIRVKVAGSKKLTINQKLKLLDDPVEIVRLAVITVSKEQKVLHKAIKDESSLIRLWAVTNATNDLWVLGLGSRDKEHVVVKTAKEKLLDFSKRLKLG
jgi:hypothetical protein